MVVLLHCAYFEFPAKVYAHNESLCDAPFAPGRHLIIDPELLFAHDAHVRLQGDRDLTKAGQNNDMAQDFLHKWLIANGTSYFVKP